jgi:Terminase large subunit, T4likevirus-type, N-terminal
MSTVPSNDAKLRLPAQPQIESELRRRRAAFVTLFPDSGPLGREFYSKHLEFFAAGATCKERLFMAANRVGKTVAGAFEATCHLTGRYPHWWQGKRFEGAIDGWACGTNSQTTRDVVQGVLLGKSAGQGMIPTEAIAHMVAGRVSRVRSRRYGCGTSPGRTRSSASKPTNRAGGPLRAKPPFLISRIIALVGVARGHPVCARYGGRVQ